MKMVSEDEEVEIRLRNATSKDCGFLYTLHKATMGEYVEKTWGWDEVFQQTHFMEHFSPETLQIVVAARFIRKAQTNQGEALAECFSL